MNFANKLALAASVSLASLATPSFAQDAQQPSQKLAKTARNWALSVLK